MHALRSIAVSRSLLAPPRLRALKVMILLSIAVKSDCTMLLICGWRTCCVAWLLALVVRIADFAAQPICYYDKAQMCIHFFFFIKRAPPEISSLPLHTSLPI